MDYAKVGGIDKPASRIVFGTDRLRGRRKWRRWWLPDPSAERQAFRLLDQVFELGCNAFDSARMYGDAERTLGAWTRSRANRDKVVVITKGCHPALPGNPTRLTPSVLSGDLHASLKAFGGDYFDLYFVHWDDPSVPLEPIVERLNRHVTEGKIGAIGVSNWKHQRIESANALAIQSGFQPFRASSVQFSLAEWTKPFAPGSVTITGAPEQEARAWYGSHNLSLFAYSSLARGFFSNHFDPAHPDANPIAKWSSTHFGSSENLARLERAHQLARKLGVTVAQVALAYVLSDPQRVFAVVGCTTADKFAQNVNALSIKLDEPTRRWLFSGDEI